jgi:GNAT superfamily N-acetyltransferase
VIVEELPVAEVYDIRRRVLREGRSDPTVRFPEDDHPRAFHLGVRDGGGPLLGVASYVPEVTPLRPGSRAVRLRGMAVDAGWQGRGLGRLLLTAGIDRLRSAGIEVLWANARDSALGFYGHFGFETVGDGFEAIGLPHHKVVLDL